MSGRDFRGDRHQLKLHTAALVKTRDRDEENTTTTSSRKDLYLSSTLGRVHRPVLISQAMEISDAKAAVDKELKVFGRLPAWDVRRVKCTSKSFSTPTMKAEQVSSRG